MDSKIFTVMAISRAHGAAGESYIEIPLRLDFWSLEGAGAAYKQTDEDETVLVVRNDRPGARGRPD